MCFVSSHKRISTNARLRVHTSVLPTDSSSAVIINQFVIRTQNFVINTGWCNCCCFCFSICLCSTISYLFVSGVFNSNCYGIFNFIVFFFLVAKSGYINKQSVRLWVDFFPTILKLWMRRITKRKTLTLQINSNNNNNKDYNRICLERFPPSDT